MPSSVGYPTFRVRSLTEMLESREGSEIQWDEWKSHVVLPSITLDNPDHLNTWVSGCRLFFLDAPYVDTATRMEVYDFGVRGRAKYLGDRVAEKRSGVRYL